MTSSLEYHNGVVSRIPASVAAYRLLWCALVVSVLTAQAVAAQSVTSGHSGGVPSSVTSQGFGGRAINGAPASVTSLPSTGNSRGVRPGSSIPRPVHPHRRDDRQYRRGSDGYYYYPYGTAYALPYADDNGTPDNDADDDPEYQGGPTIFDRRGPGAQAYVPPENSVPGAHSPSGQSSSNQDPSDASLSEPAPQPTILSFKDGHQIEVGNYAIVGATLFDLTAGHPHKIALADLDLDSTQKLNDDRGVTFTIPPSPRAN